ncbi:MAG TPA: AHH domain-containing protein, partial [Vineibacter sp.]|nr:AHH domain-containing protein [Vineibacter sp.]
MSGFVNDFFATNNPDKAAVEAARNAARDVLTAADLGGVEPHHVISESSINGSNSPRVKDLMAALDASGRYKHNGVNNLVVLPTTPEGAFATGAALHNGRHLGNPNIIDPHSEGYIRYVTQALDKIAEQWEASNRSQAALEIAQKQVIGLQNHVRAGLLAGYGNSTVVRPELALSQLDPSFANDPANPNPRGYLFNATEIWDRIQQDPWFKMGQLNGESNVNHAAMQLIADNNVLFAADRAQLRVTIDADDPTKLPRMPALRDLILSGEGRHPAFSVNGRELFLNVVQKAGDKFTLLMMAVAAEGIWQVAYNNPAFAAAIRTELEKHLTEDALEQGLWLVTQSLIQDGAKYYAASMAAGPVGLLSLITLDAYDAARVAIKIQMMANPLDQAWRDLDAGLDEFENGLVRVSRELFEGMAKDNGYSKLIVVEGIEGQGRTMEAFGGAGRDAMWATGKADVDGGEGGDWLVHLGKGLVRGSGGDDLLFSWNPKTTNGAAAVKLHGDDGNDLIVTVGGDGAYSYGGRGEDTIIAFSKEDHVYGGTGGGPDGEKDVFRVSQGTFIHDAGPEDHVTWGPIPVFGGVQPWWLEGNWAGWMPFTSLTMGASPIVLLTVFGTMGPIATKIVQFELTSALLFQFARTTSGQLIIQTGLGFGGQAVLENYDLDLETGRGDGHITVFSQSIFATRTAESTLANLERNINLALKSGIGRGLGGKDPLVLDLDGDGYELVRRGAKEVYFDLDGDDFAERTAWVAPDDGFLARDLDGNGTIDAIDELFGTEATPGLTALAAL